MTGLSRRRLEWLLRARGTDMTAWPAAERDAALALLRQSDEARLALAEALAGDDMAFDEPDGAVLRRMQGALRRRLAPLSPALRALLAGVLVACVVAGLSLAIAVPAELDATGDFFNAAQTINLAALDQ